MELILSPPKAEGSQELLLGAALWVHLKRRKYSGYELEINWFRGGSVSRKKRLKEFTKLDWEEAGKGD